MADSMTFPKKFDEFAEQYKIVDRQEVYTNGVELIPIFRVKQWLDHAKGDIVHEFAEKLKKYYNELSGKTFPPLVAYHIEQIEKEFLCDSET